MIPGERQHPLLHHGALHVVIDQDHVFLESLDGEEFLFALQLCEQHLPEAAFAQDLYEGKVVSAAPGAALPDLAVGPSFCDIISRDSWLFLKILVDPNSFLGL